MVCAVQCWKRHWAGDNVYNESRQLIAQYEKAGTGALTWKKDIVYVGAKEIAEVDATGTEITFVDHLGSPRYAWRGGTTPVIKQKFLPFGESLADPTTAKNFAKGFTNHENTDPSGLIYMQARMYIPWMGRFASPDPALDQHFQETQSWNIYSYVMNSPTMKIDPTGMVGESYGMQVSQTMLGYLEGLGTSLPFVGSRIAASLPQDVPEHQQVGREVGGYTGTATQLVAGAGEIKAGLTAMKGMQVTQMVTTTGQVVTVVNGGAQAAAGTLQAVKGGALVASAMGGGPSSPGKMQQEVKKDQAPKDVDRVDKSHTGKEEPHVHYKDGTSSTQTGKVHDAHKGTPQPSKEAVKWLKKHKWTPPSK